LKVPYCAIKFETRFNCVLFFPIDCNVSIMEIAINNNKLNQQKIVLFSNTTDYNRHCEHNADL